MTKTVCDHCGKVLNFKCDFDEIDVETLEHSFRLDLCADCYNELERRLMKVVEDFTNAEAEK